jgi:hypothetical protein
MISQPEAVTDVILKAVDEVREPAGPVGTS